MQFYEFQAKSILRKYGIRVPNGRIASTPQEAAELAREVGTSVAVKAQVRSGGRGLAGAVKLSGNLQEVGAVASSILEMNLRGEKPTAVLIEEKMNLVKEYFCAVTWDYQNKCPVLVASSNGGIDIEVIARDRPHEVVQLRIEPFLGYSQYMGRELAARIGLKGNTVIRFANIVNALWNIFVEYDAELVEVNPLGLLDDGGFAAVDAKLNLDDKSLFRQVERLKEIQILPIEPHSGLKYRQSRARESGIPTYIEMDGDLGILADGAGSGMLTLDLVKDAGGKVRVYCELGGEATAELIEKALCMMVNAGSVRIILVNLIGGLNRMDEMAVGIVNYVTKHGTEVPIVVRMTGTQEDEGRRLLVKNGIQYFDDLYDAIQRAVSPIR
jgi:succinyl-CoA synthetase beta subunit